MLENFLRVLLDVGPVGQGVLGLLFVVSVYAWAVIGVKLLNFRRARRHTDRFLRLCQSGSGTRHLHKASRRLKASPVSGLYQYVYERVNGGTRHGRWTGNRADLSRLIASAQNAQLDGLESHLGFLATVGSVSPFIGLFGTVWGIMESFHEIGLRGSANLTVVAPGIAEALVATAAGLAAAIPAVVAYNHFVGRLDALQRQVDRFGEELVILLDRDAAA